MNELETIKKDWSKEIATALIITVLAWAVGFGFYLKQVRAATSLTDISDTMSESAPNLTATHTIQWDSVTSTVTEGQTIKITFDPLTDAFSGVASTTAADIETSTNFSVVDACTANPSEVTLAAADAPGDESITLTVCAGDSIAPGVNSLTIKDGLIINPSSTGSYVIRIGGTQQNNGDTRVAIIDRVFLQASVDTTLQFTIDGVTSTDVDINGATTTGTSTATLLNFGSLVPDVPKVLGQQLRVATNARNGFVVTVHEDQNMLSTTGADIDLFPDALAVASPTVWKAPSSTLDDENTYGHLGLTSDDSDEAGTFGTPDSGEFASGTTLWVGNFNPTTTRAIFSHNGPSDGNTQDKGYAMVAYKVQIGALQEAGTDYTNQLTYICTPTF